jgi:hypothetical protein
MSMMRIIAFTFVLLAVALIIPGANPATRANSDSIEIGAGSVRTIATAGMPAAQSITVVPEPFVVAPGQPAPQPRSTVGLINALCDVTLNIVGCGFMPTEITLACDADSDLVPELVIPLKDITLVNRLLIQARLPALAPHLSGSPFPLSCCGGTATLTLTRKVGAGDDNIFGPFTESISVPVDLGIRAPVVLSASPSGGNCSVGQNLLIPGSCFVVEGNKPNVTSVFAVDRDNPNNIIQAAHFAIMNANLIDAYFEFGSSNAGKTFLIFVSGPNGTSRNLTALPEGAPFGCPIGNEAGIVITFTCDGASPPGTGDAPPVDLPLVIACDLEREPSGAFTLSVIANPPGFPETATFTVGGVAPKKVKFKIPEPGSNPPRYRRAILKGRICQGLPGGIIVTTNRPSQPFMCSRSCAN